METIRTPVFRRYTVIEQIGSGGMGTVYKAHDKHLDRLVALKLLPPALQEDESALERFNREARALAHLNHPRVAAVYDAHSEGGFPHLVMELVEGDNLERVLKKRRTLMPAEVSRIGADVAEALAHIHSHRIVHRDVKTSNIIMEPRKGAVLADFGIALEASLPRLSHGALGTPEYMSPEQAEGRDLDGRSDIYSLGVVLYECLAARPPFRREGDSLASLMSLVQRVTTDAVPPLHDLCPDVPPHLCDAVMTCLEKDPSDRFATGAELAAALRDPDSRVDRFASGRRGRTGPRVVGDDFVAEAPPLRGAGSSADASAEGRSVSNVGYRTGRRVSKGETTVLTHVEAVQSVACGPCGRLASGSNDGVVRVWDAAEGKLMYGLRRHRGSVSAVAFSRDGRFVASGDRHGRICIWDGGTGRLLQEIDALSALVLALAFSPDGKTLASGGGDRAIRLWKVRTGKLADTVGRHQGYVLSASFSGDGGRLATGGSDGQVLVWDVGRCRLLTSIQGHRGWAMSVDISADGQRILSGGADRRVRMWNATNGTLLHEIGGHLDAVMSAAFSPSGRYAVSAGRDGHVRLWDADSGRPAGRLGTRVGVVTSVSFSPDGCQAAAASDDRTVRVWDLESRQFGPRRPIKRAVAWTAIAVLALASLYGPVDVTQTNLGSVWSQAEDAAANVAGWPLWDRAFSGILPGVEDPDAEDPGRQELADTRTSDVQRTGRGAPDAEQAVVPGKQNERKDRSSDQTDDASRPADRGPEREVQVRGAEPETDDRHESRPGRSEGVARKDPSSESAEHRAAGPPQVSASDVEPAAEPDPNPADFHPLYGGGALLVGVAGWTIEVGRMHSRRGAVWLVEQYRDMGLRAGVLGVSGEGERFLVAVGHFSKRSEAETTLGLLRGQDLPFRIRVTRLRWDRMVAER